MVSRRVLHSEALTVPQRIPTSFDSVPTWSLKVALFVYYLFSALDGLVLAYDFR